MIRSIGTLAFFLFALTVARATTADSEAHYPHLRSNDAELLEAIADGTRVSPTLRRLIDRLGASDVVVYLMFDHNAAPSAAGHTSFLTAAAGRRYLRVSIDQRLIGCERIAILAHELHHALEIAESPVVMDEAGLAALYRRIGFRSGQGQGHADCFDSAGAILAGQLVKREILGRYTELTRISR